MIEIQVNNLYTVKEVASFLKTSVQTIYKEIRNGNIKSLEIGRTKITGKEVLEYINRK